MRSAAHETIRRALADDARGRTNGHPAGLPGRTVADRRSPSGSDGRSGPSRHARGERSSACVRHSEPSSARTPDSTSCRFPPAKIDKDTMDHDAVREQLELAAVEPDGLERLMAGDTPTAQAVAGHLAGCPACTRRARRACSARAVAHSRRGPGDAAGRPQGPDAGRDPCRRASSRPLRGRCRRRGGGGRSPRRRPAPAPARAAPGTELAGPPPPSCPSSAGSRRSPPPSSCRSSRRRYLVGSRVDDQLAAQVGRDQGPPGDHHGDARRSPPSPTPSMSPWPAYSDPELDGGLTSRPRRPSSWSSPAG